MDDQPVAPFNRPLGVFASREHVFLFYVHHQGEADTFAIDSSRDGVSFNHHHRSAQIKNKQKHKVKLKNCFDIRVAPVDTRYFLIYKYLLKKQACLYGAVSEDLIHWQQLDKIRNISETAIVVPDYHFENKHVMYFGDFNINLAFSKDLRNWNVDGCVIKSESNFYGDVILRMGNAVLTEEGILLLYYSIQKGPDFQKYSINAVVFDKDHPNRLIRMYDKPVWESDESWTKSKVLPLGIVDIHGQLISYWDCNQEGIKAVIHPVIKKWIPQKKHFSAYLLKKLQHNPIIKPIAEHFWESRATFNPAAIYEGGKVHLVYRAIGDKDVSVLGYATSSDGINIDYRHPEPIFTPSQPFESSSTYNHEPKYSSFASGGGCYGGCEDPRLTKIDKKIYMTYVAYNGMHHPRVALTSIKLDDFLNQKWDWQPPVLISAPGVVNKNACILPEKIDNKFVVFHRIFPNILIDYVDSLDFDGTKYLVGHFKIPPRPNFWDSRKVGIGAPPIKTGAGWLLIYQAVGDQDPSRYKIGAMLLDLKDPTRVLHRSQKPILEPHEWYENEGHKAGVAYPCGAVAFDERLHVYYGGADTVVCAASAPLPEFLDHLQSNEETRLIESSPITINC